MVRVVPIVDQLSVILLTSLLEIVVCEGMAGNGVLLVDSNGNEEPAEFVINEGLVPDSTVPTVDELVLILQSIRSWN